MAKRHTNVVGNLESLFLRLEELVLANSGEDEFEEVFKLLIAKLWDERDQSGQFRVHDSEAATASAILQLLRRAAVAWPGVLTEPMSRLTPEHLTVCVDALARHVISDESLEIMDSFFEFMVAKAAKGAKGQYFTPRHVVELCVQIIKPSASESILDPACGSGGFLIHALNYVKRGLSTENLKTFCDTNLWGFDIDDRAVRVARVLMILGGNGGANLFRLNSLLQPSMANVFNDDEPNLTIEDVCRAKTRKHKGFDVILTNPPFAGEVRERHILEAYTLAAKRNRVERDVLFVERCIQLLRPGGRMAIVLSHNKFGADSFGYLREWLIKKARILAVVGLGRNTFLPHTHQKASVLFLQKIDENAEIDRDYKIYFAISEQDGKNSKGQFLLKNGTHGTIWERVDHDLADVANGFGDFCRKERVEI